jgi:sugar phosphate isomerase/epimerase
LKRRRFIKLASATVLTGASGNLFCAKSPSNWQIGCYTRPWGEYDYRVALDGIAKAGFEYVGLMTTKSKSRLVISKDTTDDEAQQVANEIKQRNLKIVSVWAGNFSVNQSLDSGIADLKKMIRNCQIAGAPSLLIGGIGDQDYFGRYYKAVSECCDFAQELGVELALKPHGGLNATGPQCRDIVNKINHPNFRLWYDPGNIYYYSNGELDPVNDSPSVNGLVTGMCVKDYLHPKNVAVTPGTGLVDFHKVFSNLINGGFKKGPLVIEVLKPGPRDELLQEALKAKANLLQVLNGT